MSGHPDLIIVCDHGIRGGQLDGVLRYKWPERRDPRIAHWGIPFPGPSGEVRQTQLTGNHPGGDPFSTDGIPRYHHEIICVNKGCMRRAYRSDVAKLQAFFGVIATDQKFCVFTVSVTDSEITLTLDALHVARDTAKSKYGLHV